jgi:hypothetical protein
MRNAQLGEWILSWVTSPERAAATVGDLLENASGPGTFWLGVLRTALSLLWCEFASDPANMMGLAFRGLMLQLAIVVGILLIIIIGGGFLGFFAGLFWHPAGPAASINLVATAIGGLLGAGIAILVPFQVGRWMARRSPGRELAPVVAFTILTFALVRSIGMFWDTEGNIFRFILSLAAGLALWILFQIPMFVGALWVRKKQTSR